jgi:alkaline phosphatase D
MKKKCLLGIAVFITAWCINHTSAQNSLASGPMVGHVEMMEAEIWLQTNKASIVQIYYWDTTIQSPTHKNLHKLLNKTVFQSEKVFTDKKTDHIAHIKVARLEPGKVYAYRVYINHREVVLPYKTLIKTPKLWQWRGDPPEFTVALGSCMYVNDSIYDRPGKPYGSDYRIFESIHQAAPDIMLWLGDNFYYREADWYSRTGMRYRASHTRAIRELQPLLASTSHYAIWDDHDYGPNDSDGSWHLKDTALAVFQDYWANPSYGVNGKKGITSAFQYGDIDFFLMDNRYFRTANKCKTCTPRAYLGKDQIDWLIEAMVSSFAPFKIVAIGGQVLNTAKASETYINLNEDERAYLLKRIEDENIKGVVFVTGDRHFAELSHLNTTSGLQMLDITTSPLTAGLYSDPKDINTNRVEGTLVDKERNFCMLRFYGPRKARNMEISMRNTDGKVLWTQTFKQEN